MTKNSTIILTIAAFGLLAVSSASAEEQTYRPRAATISEWVGAVEQKIDQNLAYPKAIRAGYNEGTVKVRFSLGADGTPGNVSIAQSSGSSELDREALKVISKIGPLPNLPRSYANTKSLVMQVRFGAAYDEGDVTREQNLVTAMKADAMQTNIMSAAGGNNQGDAADAPPK